MGNNITKVEINGLRKPGKALEYNIGFVCKYHDSRIVIDMFSFGDVPGKTFDTSIRPRVPDAPSIKYILFAYDNEIKNKKKLCNDSVPFEETEAEARKNYPNAFVKRLGEMVVRNLSKRIDVENRVKVTLTESGLRMDVSAANTSDTDVCIFEFNE